MNLVSVRKMKTTIETNAKAFIRDLNELMEKYDVKIWRGTERIDASPVEIHSVANSCGFRYYSIRFTEYMTYEEALPYLDEQTKMEVGLMRDRKV